MCPSDAKQCSCCKTLKSRTDFYSDKMQSTGLKSECKECASAYSAKKRILKPKRPRKDPELIYKEMLLKNREWCRKNADVLKQRRREWVANNKDKQAAYDRSRRRDPLVKEKERIRSRAVYALKKGHLKRTPCVNCGGEKVEMHHPDYSKPLEVIFLCHKHHMELHRKEKEDIKINKAAALKRADSKSPYLKAS